MDGLNWGAIVVAALGAFLLGGPWYSPMLFGRVWVREANDPRPPGSGHPARVFGMSFVFSLIGAGVFAWWLGPRPALADAVTRGVLVGGGLVATSFGIHYQFANRSLRMWLIDGGYHTLQFALYGLVLGLWH